MALDHARDGIRVNSVCPGEIIRTGDEILARRGGDPPTICAARRRHSDAAPGASAEVARCVHFLASDAAVM